MKIPTLLLAAAVALSPRAALALSVTIDSTSKPYGGVTIKTGHSTSPTRSFVAAFVSLCTSHVHVTATKPPSKRQTAGAWGQSQGVQLAVNGDFFNYTTPPTVYGDAVGGGVHWPASLTGVDDTSAWYYRHYGWIAVGDGWVEFSHTKHVKDNAAAFEAAGYTVDHGFEPKKATTAIPPGTKALVSGFSELVIEGKVYTCPDPAKAGKCFPDRGDMSQAHVRTAMGLTKDRKTLIFLIMKTPSTGQELAAVMGKLGAWEAFNLDGGGSSTLWTAKSGTIFPTGEIRAVANHWGVYATGSKPEAPGSCHEAGGCFPTSVPGAEGSDFADYPASWAQYPFAKLLYDHGLDDGCGTAGGKPLYCPKCPLRRREAAVTLALAAGLDLSKPPATPSFSDVPKGDEDYAAIEAFAKAGITSGCGGGKFCPDETLTRGQAAKFLQKSAGWKAVVPAKPSFADVPANHTFYASIETIAEQCVTNGCGDGTSFCPDDPVRRDQFAAFVARTFDLGNSNKCLDYCDTGTCAGGKKCGAWSACGGLSDACDETGTKKRTCTVYADCDPLSLDETCGAKATSESQTCKVDTDGKVVSGWSAWGPCVGDPCTGAGEKTRSRVVCAAGAAKTEVQTAACAPPGVCEAPDAGVADAGGAGADGGSGSADGGSGSADGGSGSADGGSGPVDGGSGSVDGGSGPVDGGSGPVDGGAAGADGAPDGALPVWQDAAPRLHEDAARGPADAPGSGGADDRGSSAAVDAGGTGASPPGLAPDTGWLPDGGHGVGVLPDAAGSPAPTGSPSDGCTAAPSPAALPVWIWVGLALGVLRRRSRRGPGAPRSA